MVVTKHNGNSKKSVENDSQEVKAMKKDNYWFWQLKK